ncbi:MAG: ribonuclease III, partial [Leptospiraceae bacterium]|nr:ribonuclease III [Leptospiraceae bacterium]
LVINEYLYREYGTFPEGRLARIKSAVVAEAPLAAIAAEIGVGDLLLLSRGEQNSGGRTRPSNLADALEAIIAALYLDAGLEICREFVLRIFARILITHTDPIAVRDPKSLLQERVQKKYNRLPEYVTVSESGPQHRPVFEIQVLIESQLAGTGSGSSRKKAEQTAAQAALQWLDEREASSKKNPAKRRSDRAVQGQGPK